MGKVKKKQDKSTKKPKPINHLQRTYLPRAAEDPNRKHKIAEKVIDHKSEELNIWYLIRFKDMTKPQWLPETSIFMSNSECDNPRSFNKSRTEFHDRSNKSKDSSLQSSSQSRYEFVVDSRNSATSSNTQKWKRSKRIEKSQDIIAKNPTRNPVRYEKIRRDFPVEKPIESKTSKNQIVIGSCPNIATSKALTVTEPILTKGQNKRSRSEDAMHQQLTSDIERAQSQCKDSLRLTLDEFFSEIRTEMGMPQKAHILPSMQFHSADNNNGSLVLFVASVNVTPFPGRCNNISTLKKIADENISKLCIQHSLPLSYALNLVKDRDKCPMFEIKPLQIAKSRRNILVERTIMMRSKIAGVIWIEEYKSAWIIFPYHEKICSLLKLPDKKELMLFAVSMFIPSIFDPLPLKIEPKESIILPNDSFSVKEIIQTKVFLHHTEYYSELREICRGRIHFTYFGNKEFPEVQELLLVMEILGAIYDENYSENISLVLVHVLFLKQLLFMRNLMDFKRLPNCRFLLFGTDLIGSYKPIRFKEHLPNGGMISATTFTFLQEEQVSNRIINVIDYQDAPWDYLLYINVMDNLADLGQNQNNQRAFQAWHEAMAAIGMKKARYIRREEMFMPEKVPEEPPSMVSSLTRTMLRIHTMYASERRHFILIRHPKEEEFSNVSFPGVWKMSLQEFEQNFGTTM
ncbi:3279_t:CDS:10 [Funneliformis caledonium]|uniref:3279_t:CDS:1 n=1 Tax=Funneliformis caledonium TaxID=1117310 RepID=A0A9N9DCL3_9GLOM|nr:3279_t:CDS:10 [Funneliformis caledonium]